MNHYEFLSEDKQQRTDILNGSTVKIVEANLEQGAIIKK